MPLGLTALAGDVLADSRTGKNGWHGVVGLLRQSVYGRLAGYEDVNDAERLGPFLHWCYAPSGRTGKSRLRGALKRVWRILPPRKEDKMSRKRYTPEQIISMLREAEVALAQGQSIGQACRALGVSEQSYYRWRKEYGGLRTDQAKRLKDLEKENGRLRKAISDLTLDKLILKEALEGNC